MLWFDGLRLKLRKRWDRLDATFVDSRFVKLKVHGGDEPATVHLWEYMVDVPARDGGEPVRMTFTEDQSKVRDEPKRGTPVPVVVNAKRTKIMFDLSDPRIDKHGWYDEQARQRKQKDDERFEAQRNKKPSRRPD